MINLSIDIHRLKSVKPNRLLQ